jgi:tRNA threonylcarbamoyladenosine biosynthesis protein TsaE
MEIVSKSIKENMAVAQDFLNQILKGKKSSSGALVIALSGDLGTGKTSFTQAVAKILGIKNKINSPTFVIMKKYSIKTGEYKFLYHLDAYRLKNEKELLHLGWQEIIDNKDNLIMIEWPENVAGVMPRSHHKIQISHTKEGYRKFKI